MTSNNEQQLVNGRDEDPYKSGGRIEFKIEKLSGFIQEKLYTRRLSAPVYVCGAPWNIYARILECDQPAAQNGQKQRCLGYFLQCNDRSTDPSWSFSTKVNLKLLAQKEGSVDRVFKFSQIFDAKSSSLGFSPHMKFDYIMDPNNGWYDEQADSITLAVDFTAHMTEGFREYILVAENELKLDKVPTCFSMQIGQMEWQIDFDFVDQNKKEEKSVVISCKDMMANKTSKGVDNNDNTKVLMELFCYRRDDPKSELYSPMFEESAAVCRQLHLFTSKDNSQTVKGVSNNILFTFRVFKDCTQFPNFTEPTATVERNAANVILRVGDQQFHANKQMLSMHSLFFDRMFHGDYTAATQQEVELSLITHSAELFHHFLLVMCVNEVLPNSMNVGALFKLADFYDAENVHKKCDLHLRMAREMPIEKRVLLARDYGTKETRTLIMNSINFEQSKRINLLLLENRSL